MQHELNGHVLDVTQAALESIQHANFDAVLDLVAAEMFKGEIATGDGIRLSATAMNDIRQRRR